MRFAKTLSLAVLLALGLAGNAQAEIFKNHFASVHVAGKKIGQVHFTARHSDEGILQELTTRSSYSIFGVEVYHHSIDVHELWKAEELLTLKVSSDDNGDYYDASIVREPSGYAGELNSKHIALPLDAFPVAVWHYAITEKKLLFNLPDMGLYSVQVAKSNDTVVRGGKKTPAEKFKFSGDWEAAVWYDLDQQFIKWTYKVLGFEVTVLLDE